MRIKINNKTGGVVTNGATFKPGRVYEVNRSIGDGLVSAGHAVEVLPHGPKPGPETATAEPEAERAVEPKPVKRKRKRPRKDDQDGSEA